MLKVLGNRLEPYNNVIKIEIYETDDDHGQDLGIVGETRKFIFKKTATIHCQVLSEQQLKNLGLINAELLKIEAMRDGSITLMVML